ncbi:MAG: histidine phosphatase family protein [Christensenellaceae bacterium]|jgi:broad specificity phosphatase PhoE|nr:histidine phosphatase family protein [Christensenellaceae bacterium]
MDKKSRFILPAIDNEDTLFVFIRHAESVGNDEKTTREEKQKYADSAFDFPLSLKGAADIEQLKPYCEHICEICNKIYCSDTTRAKATAKGLFGENMPLSVDVRLNEQDFSKFKEKDLNHPELNLFERAKENGLVDLRYPNYVFDETMETPASVQKRMFSFVKDRRQAQEKFVIAISHAGTMKCIKGLLIDDLPEGKYQHELLSPKNLEVIKFTYSQLLQQIEKKNAQDYLFKNDTLLRS